MIERHSHIKGLDRVNSRLMQIRDLAEAGGRLAVDNEAPLHIYQGLFEAIEEIACKAERKMDKLQLKKLRRKWKKKEA